MKVILLRLEAPLMAFGGIVVDHNGETDELPSASMLTGLIGNALGFCRSDAARLQDLQSRLRFIVRADRQGEALVDFQTAQLAKDDKAWTTSGTPSGRDGGQKTYSSPHIRYRHYFADASIVVATYLLPEHESPTPIECAAALKNPARPLFVGRKPCVPSEPLLAGLVDADSPLEALQQEPLATTESEAPIWLYQPCDKLDGVDVIRLSSRRDWANDVHQGTEIWTRSQWGGSS